MFKSNNREDLLIEIGCEELPPKLLKNISQEFSTAITSELKNLGLHFENIQSFATPRRLAIIVHKLSPKTPEKNIIRRGPAQTVAFDTNGKPTNALLKFAESCGVSYEKLTLQETEKGSWFIFKQLEPGKSCPELLPKLVENALDSIPVGRRMRWGDSEYKFSRPIHWIVMIMGSKVISGELFGIKIGMETRGHRFHHPDPFKIKSLDQYESELQHAYVMADFEKRKAKIKNDAIQSALKESATPLIDEDLLDEVTGLVEWPVVVVGQFEEKFLALPKEALISSMQTHQRCFPLLDSNGKLLAKFIMVSNINSKDPKTVIHGNESVMRARLSDAEFYYNVDKNMPLIQRKELLKNIVFQAGLGTLYDKTNRITNLSQIIARKLGLDVIYCERAAILSKTDLTTQMVGEFPELQGIMGYYYALHDGEPKTVAEAIREYYHPRFANDTLPNTLESAALSIVDRIDSLVGLFGIGKKPTGDKDPFGLRRLAMGILRIIIEKQIDIDLLELIQYSLADYKIGFTEQNLAQQVLDFCFDRMRAWYAEQGIATRIFDAVLAKRPTSPLDFQNRIKAVSEFKTMPQAESLAAANKRVQNILSKSDIQIATDGHFNDVLLKEPAEIKLAKSLSEKEKELSPLLKNKEYTKALKMLADLRDPIDLFFTEVMVMVEDTNLRNNRLKLLTRLRNSFLEIADISLL